MVNRIASNPLEYTVDMSKPPKRFMKFMNDYPEVGAAYRSMTDAVAGAGPLDVKTRELVKIGIAIWIGPGGGDLHSHVRKALDAGATPEELRHVALQALTTIGFPSMMMGLAWVEHVLEEGS